MDLAFRSPTTIAVECGTQRSLGERSRAVRGVKPRGQFIGHCLVLNEAVVLRETDGFFVERQRVAILVAEP